MNKIIGTAYGGILGSVLGSIAEEFTIDEVEEATAFIIAQLRRVKRMPEVTDAIGEAIQCVASALHRTDG